MRTWLEVALNGPWSRSLQPLMPISVEEIVADGIACAKEGAAVLHVHAYDVATGRQRDDAAIYAAIIEGIRAEVDAIVYPTIPLAGGPDAAAPTSAAERFRAVEELARRGLVEWTVVDPGSANLVRFAEVERGRDGFVYRNPTAEVRYGLELCAAYRLVPSYACYEPGFVRLGAALARRHPGAFPPVYRLMFSEGFSFGFPPRPYALDAYLSLLGEAAPGAHWMVAGLAVDVLPLAGETVARGGHLRVGLEDAPFGSERGNLEWTRAAARAIAAAGGTLATANEIRAALGERGRTAI